MNRKIAVIGVGNMARSIISGVISAKMPIDGYFLYDKYPSACDTFKGTDNVYMAKDIAEAVKDANCVLLSVKPQNYPEVLEEISSLPFHEKKLYISIAAGITSESVSQRLGGATVIRVLPNLPMTVGCGVSAICKSNVASTEDFDFVKSVFACAGSVTVIDESEMNRVIGVTSSSPAYVFKFIEAIKKGAEAQGLDGHALLDAICDMVIGSAVLLKGSDLSPAELISRVASKGGTTEQALLKLNEADFDGAIENAMKACTKRADELGKQ